MSPPPKPSAEATIRRALLARLGWIAAAAGLAVVGPALAISEARDANDGHLDNLQRAREIAATEEHQPATIVDTPGFLDRFSWRTGGGSFVTTDLDEGEQIETWSRESGPWTIVTGWDAGDRVTVAVDEGNDWAVVVDDVEGSRLDAMLYTVSSLSVLVFFGLMFARKAYREGEPIPPRGVFALLVSSGSRLTGTVVAVLASDRRGEVTFKIAASRFEYSWDVVVPHASMLEVGRTFELRGHLKDGGWMVGVDERYGPFFPRAPLRRWKDAPTDSWHPD